MLLTPLMLKAIQTHRRIRILKSRFLGYLRHTSLLSGIAACALLAASPAYSASFSYSSTVTTAAGTYLGGPGFYLPYTAGNGSAAVPSSLQLIELGTFVTAPASAAPNKDVVTSTFTLDVNLGLSGVSSPVSFTGSVTPFSGGNYDFTFNGNPYVWSADPNGSATFDVQTVGTCSSSLLGCYTVGIEPIQINSSGKTTGLWAFVGPANLTTPEPSTAALMALSSIGLLLFAVRRKLHAQRSNYR